jgi:hypothetical protein
VLGWSAFPFRAYALRFPEFNLPSTRGRGTGAGSFRCGDLPPSPIVCGLAELLYNEPYTAVR